MLESFNSLLLAYSPKRAAFQSVYILSLLDHYCYSMCIAEIWPIRLGYNLLFWITIIIYREGKQLQNLEIQCFIENIVNNLRSGMQHQQ